VVDLVDIAIPSNARAAAEALGLKVYHSVTSGARAQQIPRDEGQIAVECLSDLGFSARDRGPASKWKPIRAGRYDGRLALVTSTIICWMFIASASNYPDLKRKARELAQLHHADTILIEDKASGTQLIQDLKAAEDDHLRTVWSLTQKSAATFVPASPVSPC
jgi:hypothetical protein